MITMIIRHTVKNYDLWRKGFDANAAAREAAGFTDTKVYQSPELPNEIVVINKIIDRQRAEAFAASEDIRLEDIKVGVIGIPEIYFAE